MATAVRQQGIERQRSRWAVIGAGVPALAIAAAAVAAGGCTSSPSAAAPHKPVVSPVTVKVTVPPPTTSTIPATPTTTPATPPPPPPPAVALTSAEVSKVQQGNKPYTVSCEYPVLGGAAGAAPVNAAIQSSVLGQVAAFEKEANGAALVPNAPGPWQFTCAWSTVWISPTLGSLSFRATDFPAGAAHPFAQISTFNFDPATGQVYTLAGLFRSGSDYLKVLSQESYALLPAVLDSEGADIPDYNPGVGPKAANFAAWTMTPAGVDITFQEYQVAAYAFGNPTIQIERSALSSIADPSGPLA